MFKAPLFERIFVTSQLLLVHWTVTFTTAQFYHDKTMIEIGVETIMNHDYLHVCVLIPGPFNGESPPSIGAWEKQCLEVIGTDHIEKVLLGKAMT